MYTCMCVYNCTHVFVCMNEVRVCMYICMYTCMCVYKCVFNSWPLPRVCADTHTADLTCTCIHITIISTKKCTYACSPFYDMEQKCFSAYIFRLSYQADMLFSHFFCEERFLEGSPKCMYMYTCSTFHDTQKASAHTFQLFYETHASFSPRRF